MLIQLFSDPLWQHICHFPVLPGGSLRCGLHHMLLMLKVRIQVKVFWTNRLLPQVIT